MDPDLHLDLRHLDDPEPPSFGPPQAEEAAYLAAGHQARRARVLAAAVVAVAAVTGVGLATSGDDDPMARLSTAQSSIVPAPPDTDGGGSTTLAPAPADPATSVPATTSPAAPPTTNGPGATATSAAPPPPTAGPKPTSVPTTRPIGSVAGPAPEGTVPAPAGLRFTLTLDATQVTVEGMVHGKVRFENGRSTSIRVSGGGCGDGAQWDPNLYKAGRFAPGTPPDCMMLLSEDVPAGGISETDVWLYAGAETPPGAYDAFSVITVEEDQVTVHSNRVGVTVVRP